MSSSFLAASAERETALTVKDHAVQDECLFLTALPHDLLVLLSERMLGKPALALASCCRVLWAAGMNEQSWSRRLQWELGFTQVGITQWLAGGRSLLQCFLYHFVKHEAVEAECLREMPVRAPGWRGCHDVRVCLEFVNRWPVPIWTFISTRSFASLEEIPLRAYADVYCSRFEASHGRGQAHRVLSFADCDGASRELPPGAQLDALIAQGWVMDTRGGTAMYGSDKRAVPAITAVPLAAQPDLVAISEFTLRIDADTWAAAGERGALVLHVLQAVDVVLATQDEALAALDTAINTTERYHEDAGTDPYQPSFQARPLSGGRGDEEEQTDMERPSCWVFLRSRESPVPLFTHLPPEKLGLAALRRTEVVLELDSL